mmetsp:Transcript_39831/g.115251  ORF Transcript_39831/g.115251 Transcript_39831/m.115251 type:complete len:200 (-) Transcript_39831:112-711(-)
MLAADRRPGGRVAFQVETNGRREESTGQDTIHVHADLDLDAAVELQNGARRHHRRSDGGRHGHPSEYVLRSHRGVAIHQRHVLRLHPHIGLRLLRAIEAVGGRACGDGLVARTRRSARAAHQGGMPGVVCDGRRELGPCPGRDVPGAICELGMPDRRRCGRDANRGLHLAPRFPRLLPRAPGDQRLHQRRCHHHRPQPA